MTGEKLLGTMEGFVWQPPLLLVPVEAALQEWRLELDKKTAWCEERRFRRFGHDNPG